MTLLMVLLFDLVCKTQNVQDLSLEPTDESGKEAYSIGEFKGEGVYL